MVEELIKSAINGAKDKIDSEVDKLNEKYSQYGLGR